MAFLSQVKSKDKIYVYLTEYIPLEKRSYSNKNQIHVYGFGEKNKALEMMKRWKKGKEFFPLELYERGYNYSDLCDWIDTLDPVFTKK